MDAFKLHKDVITNYKKYLQSFTTIKDQRIKKEVDEAFKEGNFIPEPLIQFNPGFAKGKQLGELAVSGEIHHDLPAIFGSYNLYYHQYEALKMGVNGKGFIVTSGTGSGKSLTYLASVFNYILEQKEEKKGIKAIFVYPMNALINSQEEEIRKYHLKYLLNKIKPENPEQYTALPLKDAIERLETKYKLLFPVTYRKYTGQEGREARDEVREELPHIVLTNYMMLELLMTREAEKWLRTSIEKHLKFLVFDELHTYRGRQGADVSFLVRRIKNKARNDLVCIGTSATMITEGTAEGRKQEIMKAAETIFSTPFTSEQIIEETLTSSTRFDGNVPAPVNAFILMELGLSSLRLSVSDVIDVSQPVTLPLHDEIARYIEDQQKQWHHEWVRKFRFVIDDLSEKLKRTYWFNDTWLNTQASKFLNRFDSSFERWRHMYKNALAMKERAQTVVDDPTIKYGSDEAKEARRQRNVGEKQLALLRNERSVEYGNESEFYVFRFLAAEGFLPGYNFTRLPVRAFVGYRHQEEGQYISRPRFLALREFGPMNLIYHNGSKYQINRMMLIDAEEKRRTIKISKTTGYAFLDDEAKLANNDPITHQELKGEDNVEVVHCLLEISESEGIPRERISCEEEERMSRGFEISHYFRYPNGIESTKSSVIKAGNQPLLQVIYGPATELIQLNRKWKRSLDSKGFSIDNRTGKWLRQSDLEREETREHARDVLLFARDTADTLYIQPLKDLEVKADQTFTLSFALKRGIERLFQEDRHKRKLLWESGYDIIEWYYTEPLEALVIRRKDVFRRVC